MMLDATTDRNVERNFFGTLSDGQRIDLFRLLAGQYQAEVITFGASLRAFRGPDREGNIDSVVLGYAHLNDYVTARERQGAIMGRVVNRIGRAKFDLDGRTFLLSKNNGDHSIHGGEEGFDRRVWTVEAMDSSVHHAMISLSLESPDGDQGFPGTMNANVTYHLDRSGALTISYRAQTDRPTIVNLTNHAYFNLGGEGCGSALDQEFEIFADYYLPIDESILPTGQIQSVTNTPFDFRRPRTLAQGVRSDCEQIRFGRGYDHCFVLDSTAAGEMRLAARVRDPVRGRVLEVLTTEPGMQLNSGNVLSGRFAGDKGRTYRQSDGFCLETQHFPDSINNDHFPTVVLRSDKAYVSQTIYKLSTYHTHMVLKP